MNVHYAEISHRDRRSDMLRDARGGQLVKAARLDAFAPPTAEKRRRPTRHAAPARLVGALLALLLAAVRGPSRMAE